VVPRTTPDGFKIEAAGGALTIGPGRMYVDGILIENHGAAPLAWDPQLAEVVGKAPLGYAEQPYFPNPTQLPGGGPHLVYLDVWQREVTYLQHPELVEKAVGVDTTGRLQTAWQVKLLPNVGNIECSTPDDQIPGWLDVIAPSASRLTTGVGIPVESTDPCLVPPSGGYLGTENQLYRVEIHDDGVAGTAHFKWSRDNATVVTLISQINGARDRLVVDTIGKDDLLRFSDGDWVEITDDVRELHGESGVVRRIKLGGGVDDPTRTIVLDSPLPAGLFPTGAQDRTDPSRHTRIRRWDQSGRVLRANGSLFIDLDAAGSTGLIPVPPDGTSLFLENGILVSFSLSGSGGFRAGDHWTFAARAADASVELLDNAPPRGVHHHYARLAIVTFPDSETSCRVFWPPEVTAAESCACDRCVSVEGHTSGVATLQQAVDQLAQTGGVICLEAGTYRLREPLRILNAGALTIRGKGWRTVIVPETPGPAIRISDSISVTLEDFAVVGAAREGDVQALLEARNTVGLDLNHLYLLSLSPTDTASAAVELSGYALGTSVRQCAVMADVGITGGRRREARLLTATLSIADNLLFCNGTGVQLGNRAFHYGETTIARNLVLAARDAGIQAIGGGLPGAACRIDANTISVQGDGIVAGVDGLRITDNEVLGATARRPGNGIVLTAGVDPAGIGHVWVTGNRVSRIAGSAIEVRTPLGAAMIKQNVLERSHAGIVFTERGASAHLSIENNQLLQIGAGFNPAGTSVVGIQVLSGRDVSIVGNTISAFAQDALQASDRVAIRLAASDDVRIASNRLGDLGPVVAHAGYVAGIEILVPYGKAMITDNVISRSSATDEAESQWMALRIGVPVERGFSSLAGATMVSLGADQQMLLTRTLIRQIAQRLGDTVSIRGNFAQARMTALPLAWSQGAGTCIFSDNHFEGTSRSRFPLVLLNAVTVAASHNRLRWLSDDTDALNITGSKKFTVLGNLTMGNIRIDGGALPAKWAEFNELAG
jgi:hypothetical protein